MKRRQKRVSIHFNFIKYFISSQRRRSYIVRIQHKRSSIHQQIQSTGKKEGGLVHGKTKTKTLEQLHVEVKGHSFPKDTFRYLTYWHMTRSPQGKVYKTGGQTKHEQGRIIVIKKRVLRLKCHNTESEAVSRQLCECCRDIAA